MTCARPWVLLAVFSACWVHTSTRGPSVSIRDAARGMKKELDEDNKGFRMLKSMGWNSGGLGPARDGMIEPIDPLANASPNTGRRRGGIGTGDTLDEIGGRGGHSRRDRRRERWQAERRRRDRQPRGMV